MILFPFLCISITYNSEYGPESMILLGFQRDFYASSSRSYCLVIVVLERHQWDPSSLQTMDVCSLSLCFRVFASNDYLFKHLAHDTRLLSPTCMNIWFDIRNIHFTFNIVDVDHAQVQFLGNLTLNIWDCGGYVWWFSQMHNSFSIVRTDSYKKHSTSEVRKSSVMSSSWFLYLTSTVRILMYKIQ